MSTPRPASPTPQGNPQGSPLHTTITILSYVTYLDYSYAAINLNTNAFNTTTHTNTESFNSYRAGTGPTSSTEHRARYDGSQRGSASSGLTGRSEGSESQNPSTETSNNASVQEGEILGSSYRGGEGHDDSMNTQDITEQHLEDDYSPSNHDNPSVRSVSHDSLPRPSLGGRNNSNDDIGQRRRVRAGKWRRLIVKFRAFLHRRWTRHLER